MSDKPTVAAYAGYSEFADQYEAAYTAFRATYELRNPQPAEPPRTARNLGTIIALVIMLVASVIVSGSRTIYEFGGGLLGFAGFVMLDITMISYAFIRTSRNYSAEKHRALQSWINGGLGLSFVVLMSANVDAVLSSQYQLPVWVDVVISLLLALSAPVLSFITGDVLGSLSVENRQQARKATDEYAAAVAAWQAGLNNAWNAQKAKWGVQIEVVREPVRVGTPQLDSASAVRPLDTDMDGRGHGTGQGYNKRTDARTLVWTYLNEHPEAADKPVRELAEVIGAGKSTVAEELKKWRASR